MERVAQVTRSASALIVAKLVTSVMMFLLAIVVNRRLGPELAGIYVYAIALYTIMQIIPDFGIGNILIRDVSPNWARAQRYFRNTVVIRLMLGLASFTLLVLADVISAAASGSGAFSSDRFWAVFAIAFCLLLEQPLSNTLSEIFISLERQLVVAGVYMIMGFLRVSLSLYVLLTKTEHAVVLLVIIYLVTIVYSIIHFSIVYRRWLGREGRALAREELEGSGSASAPAVSEDPSPFAAANIPERIEVPEPAEKAIDKQLWRYLIKSSWPLAVAAAAVVLYAGLDIPMVSWIAGDRASGLYNAGAMYAKAFAFLAIAANMAILPAISLVGDKRPEQLGEVWEQILRYVFIVVLPFTVLIPVLARPVLQLQEHNFIQAWVVTWLTMAAVNFTVLTSISYLFFIVINRQKRIIPVVAAGVVAKVALNVILISAWSFRGAAVTALVTDVLAFFLIYYLLSRDMGHRFHFLRLAGTPILSVAVLYGTVFALEKVLRSDSVLTSIGYALLISVIVVVIYVVLAFATRFITRKGLNELNELLKVD